MLVNCDLTSAFEDGGIGGIVMAIAWGLWTWYKSHGAAAKKSTYEK